MNQHPQQSPYRTLSIGGATYDLFVRLPKETVHECDKAESFALPLGAKIRVDELIEACGGGASNTSVGLSRLGCDAHFEGVLSSDQWGEKLLQNLRANGVQTDCVTIVENEVSSFSIILSGSSGERVILYEPGTNAHLHDVTFDKHVLSTVDWVYLNHIQEGSCVIQDDIVEKLAIDNGPGLTWNPGGCQIDRGIHPEATAALLKHTDLLLLNKREILAFTQSDSTEDAIKSVADAGVKHVIVTEGKNGSTGFDGHTLYRCPVLENIDSIDTTGAGDAFGTAATWALLSGMPLPEAMKAGTIQGASVVGAVGAQTALLTDTEITQRLETIDLAVTATPLS